MLTEEEKKKKEEEESKVADEPPVPEPESQELKNPSRVLKA